MVPRAFISKDKPRISYNSNCILIIVRWLFTRIGKRFTCDKCGRIESPTITIYPSSTDPDKHICDICRNSSLSEAISSRIESPSSKFKE
jgi:hypothetical protein